MSTTTTTNTVTNIKIGDIDPDPDNRTATIDKAFVQSIAEHGIIQPVTLRTHPNNPKRWMLIAGHRRMLGATKAGLAALPSIVRNDLDDQARIAVQVVENLQREDLTPSQEVTQLLRAITVGHTVKSLATAIGRSQKFVRERLAIAELPKPLIQKLDGGDWTIAEALAATKLIDHPDKLEVLANLNHWERVENTVDMILQSIQFTADVETLTAKAHADGLALIDKHDKDKYELLLTLAIPDEDHQGEPCHAVIVGGQPATGARFQGVCTNRKNHNKAGSSDVKLPAKTSSLSDEQRKANADKKAANAARQEAMAVALQAKVPKAETDTLTQRTVVTLANEDLAKAALRLLGIDYPKDSYKGTILADYAAENRANLTRAALAVSFAKSDEAVAHPWGARKKQGKAWLAWLKKHTGFKPSEWDRKQVAE